jgi:glycosyltransferase involved in cell wall biosynthesis
MKLLVTHPWLGHGGSEAVAAWCLDAVQDHYEVTLVTSSPVDFDAINRTFGSRLKPSKVRVLTAPRLPGVRNGEQLASLQHAVFGRFVAKQAPKFDLALNCYNFVPLPIPAVHMVADFSWDDAALSVANPEAAAGFRGKRLGVRGAYLRLARMVYPLNDTRLIRHHDLVVANSEWTRSYLYEGFGVEAHETVSPPILLAVEGATSLQLRDPELFVCMGRVSVEKRVEEVIQILAGVRASGFNARLVIAGKFGDDGYSQKIAALCKVNSAWVETPGFLDHNQKRELLSRATYAIHACEGEAFGIAVGEFVSCGCIPFVPVSGGAKELVENDSCRYSDRGDAVDKILAMAASEGLRREARLSLDLVRARVTPEAFSRRIRDLVAKCGQRAGKMSEGQERVDRLTRLKNQMAEAETVVLATARPNDIDA